MEQILGRSDPWCSQGCTRGNCFQCQHGGGEGGDCQKESVLYEITCLKCKEAMKSTIYVGESARTGQCRGEDHLSDLRSKRQGKPLWTHSEEDHDGKLQNGDFKMKVVKKYCTPLQRQIGEALLIEKRSWTCDTVLNKKGEWNGTRVPRLRD